MKYEAIKVVLSPEFRLQTGLKCDELFALVWFITYSDMPYTKNDVLLGLGIQKSKFYDILTKYIKLNIIQDTKMPININNIYNYINSFYQNIENTNKYKGDEFFRICGKISDTSKEFFRICGKIPLLNSVVPPSHTLPPNKIPIILRNNYNINYLSKLKYILLYNLQEKEKKEITPLTPLKKKMKEQNLSLDVNKKFDEILAYINSHSADIWRENFTRRFGKSPQSVFEKFKFHILGNCKQDELFNMAYNKILSWIYNSAPYWINQDDDGEIKATPVKLGIGEFIKGSKRFYKRGDKVKEVPMDAPTRLGDMYEWVDGKWVYFGYWS